jgi:hypothetical protein
MSNLFDLCEGLSIILMSAVDNPKTTLGVIAAAFAIGCPTASYIQGKIIKRQEKGPKQFIVMWKQTQTIHGM